MTENYDVIVIGAGATGENVADRTQKGGLSTVIIESELVGGECFTGPVCPPRPFCERVRACERQSGPMAFVVP
jgi:pyruvate/2-oxoglutarate dehydrogenase complex dihydrolipoamide dehydrogenase (E3) component